MLSRRQLSALGLTRWEAMAELDAARWTIVGPQAIRIGSALDAEDAYVWRCLISVSPLAVVAGLSALVLAGLSGITCDRVHVAVPKSSRPRRPPGVVVHETRRFDESKVRRSGIPRERPEFAAVHGALWAVSDRQAALIVAASVQQRIVTADALSEAVGTVRRHRRRRLLVAVMRDVCAGAESMGELDFAGMCRERAFPSPTGRSCAGCPAARC